MVESDFSWFKLASFFGVAILALLCFVAIGSGITLITESKLFGGIAAVVGGVLCGAGAVWTYINYQKKSLAPYYDNKKK